MFLSFLPLVAMKLSSTKLFIGVFKLDFFSYSCILMLSRYDHTYRLCFRIGLIKVPCIKRFAFWTGLPGNLRILSFEFASRYKDPTFPELNFLPWLPLTLEYIDSKYRKLSCMQLLLFMFHFKIFSEHCLNSWILSVIEELNFFLELAISPVNNGSKEACKCVSKHNI